MNKAVPKGSAVYVRYRDHILFRNITKPIDKPVERETMGWLMDESDEVICIIWDKNVKPPPNHKNSPHSGLIILKNCIREIHALPLQRISHWHLTSRNHIIIPAECALQNAKRKTQPKC